MFTIFFSAICYFGASGLVSWTIYEETTTTGCQISRKYGLIGYKVEYDGCSTQFSNAEYKYSENKCITTDVCDSCLASGETVLSAMAAGTLATFVAIIFVQMRRNDTVSHSDRGCSKRFVSFAALAFVFLAGCVSWSTWQADCDKAITDALKENNYEGNVSLSWGFSMALCATFFAGAAALNELCIHQSTRHLEGE